MAGMDSPKDEGSQKMICKYTLSSSSQQVYGILYVTHSSALHCEVVELSSHGVPFLLTPYATSR